MGQELARLVVDPIARILTSFNEACFGTGCESDCQICGGNTCHLMTRARTESENEETVEREDDRIHPGVK